MIPKAVIDKVQAFPHPTTVKQLQTYRSLGVLESIHSPPGATLQPLSQLSQRERHGPGLQVEEAFLTAKRVMAQTQTLQVVDSTQPLATAWAKKGAHWVPFSAIEGSRELVLPR